MLCTFILLNKTSGACKDTKLSKNKTCETCYWLIYNIYSILVRNSIQKTEQGKQKPADTWRMEDDVIVSLVRRRVLVISPLSPGHKTWEVDPFPAETTPSVKPCASVSPPMTRSLDMFLKKKSSNELARSRLSPGIRVSLVKAFFYPLGQKTFFRSEPSSSRGSGTEQRLSKTSPWAQSPSSRRVPQKPQDSGTDSTHR